MVVILREKFNEDQRDNLVNWLESLGITVHSSLGAHNTVLGLVGDTSGIDIDLIKALDIVEDVKRIQEPYKNANRKFHPEDTVVVIDKEQDIKIGGGNFQIIAGPCSVESEEQVCGIAQAVKKSGATLLRGGAFKPRTSPYAFQGLRAEGLKLLLEAKKLTGMPIVTEIMDLSQLPLFDEVDVIQVILCERGIRTFETYTRNTLDISAVPAVKTLSHLPIIVDPSHATGISRLVKPMAFAATAAGADGLIIEVHNDPEHALCDGPQSLTPEAFEDVVKGVNSIRPFAYRM